MITHPVLSSLIGSGIRLGLERVEEFLEWIGSPHRAAPVIHVAGTNGKGSVCTYVTAALVEAGYRVGTYTSPHLEHVNERFRISGQPLSDEALDARIRALDGQRKAWAKEQGFDEAPLTYFEFVTALAFAVFAEEAVDVVVLEVGLGGRLDATNVVDPLVCAITSIGLDHCDKLGDTYGQIAAEKAGIIKEGVPCVVGAVPTDAAEVIAQIGATRHSEMWWVGREIHGTWPEGRIQTPLGTVTGVRPAMAGQHQRGNAQVAIGVLMAAAEAGLGRLKPEHMVTGVNTGVLAGRAEWLSPTLLVDGAHNALGAKALAAILKTLPPAEKTILLFGIGQDRDPEQLLTPLLPFVSSVYLTWCAHPKATMGQALAEKVGEIPAHTVLAGAVEEALPRALTEADRVVVAGSLYVVGAVRSVWADLGR